MKRMILLFLVASLMAGVRMPAAIDDPEATHDRSQNSPALGPKVTPAPGATVVREPAPPTRTPVTTEIKTTITKSTSPSEIGKYLRIVERSPFRNTMVPQMAGAAATANAQLRLNGIIRIGDQLSAGIEDTIQRRSLIVAVGHPEEGIEIQSIDELNQTVSLLYNGQAMTLAMDQTPGMSGAPMPVAPGMNPTPMRAGEPAPTNIQPAGNPQQPAAKRKRIIIPREK